jgi:DNA-binding CsgD family transcriptional regulator
MLELLGLDPSSEAVYRLVLGQPTWGIEEITGYLGWPENEVRTALDALADLHLLRPYEGDPDRLQPVSPEVGLASLLARREAELGRRQAQIEATRAAVAALTTEYGTGYGYAPEVIERLEGLDEVRSRLDELALTAQCECLSFLPGGARKLDAMEAGAPLNQRMLDNGVLIRDIYQDSFRNDPATLRHVQWLTSLGVEARTVPSLPMLMVVFDRKVALVPLDPDDGRKGALEIRSPGAVAVMCALFEQVWSVAVPWGEQLQRDSHGLTPQERELLRLLATGHTDQVASRKLGVSLRTVRRMASELMARLEARSRFEAGVRAVRNGWL